MTTVDRWSGRDTRLLRHALRLTVRDFAEDLGVSPRTVSKWEAGGATLQPRPELQRALDTMLARASDEERTRFTEALDRTHTDGEFDGSGGLTTAHPGTEARVAGLPATQSLTEAHAVVADSAARTAAFAVWWEAASTGPVSVDALIGELRRLAADYLNGPPGPVVLGLRDVRYAVFRLLRQPQPPSSARDLHLAAGYACMLLAWLSGDLGQLGAADTHARVGTMFAGTSGSTELQAWVQAVRSKTAFWSGDYRRAVEQATAGLEAAPATGVRVLLAAQVADAWATLGAHAPARAALRDVSVARNAVVDSDTIGGLLSCTPAREANYLSGVYQQLGDVPQAVAAADDALALSRAQPVRSYATEAQIRLNRVNVFLELGDLDAAHEALRPVCGLPLDRRLFTLTRRVARVGEILEAPRFVGNHAAKALREQVAEFADGTLPTAT
ncbi:MAG: helix-turn-helix transcriptional regulator [Actinobacteria bacterium]|nr:helix-turn-helix transcriptional regulator [Actinomycetota bacterium]MBI3688327.1 helix-turn-helix transcriptional regulator [Actinomycetota bacterium]